MISLAKEYNQSEHVSFFADDVGSIAFIDQTADIIFARGFLHHVDDIDRIMVGLKRIAKPGAYFIAIEPNNGNIFIQFFRKIRQKIDPQYSHLQHYFSRAELLELLDRANMKEVNVTYHGYVSPPFAEIVLNPQFIFLPVVKFLVFLDEIILRWAPPFFRPLSWNLIVFARFPEDNKFNILMLFFREKVQGKFLNTNPSCYPRALIEEARTNRPTFSSKPCGVTG